VVSVGSLSCRADHQGSRADHMQTGGKKKGEKKGFDTYNERRLNLTASFSLLRWDAIRAAGREKKRGEKTSNAHLFPLPSVSLLGRETRSASLWRHVSPPIVGWRKEEKKGREKKKGRDRLGILFAGYTPAPEARGKGGRGRKKNPICFGGFPPNSTLLGGEERKKEGRSRLGIKNRGSWRADGVGANRREGKKIRPRL